MTPILPLHGLVAAPHTPFQTDGSLNLAGVDQQAAHFLKHKLTTLFVGGTTGESSSMTQAERKALVQRWGDVARGTGLRLVVHVGSNCLADSRDLALQAESIGAIAVSAVAPSYFKPGSVEVLVACCAEIASAVPSMPFYFYDIPALTGVCLSMPGFLNAARDTIPNLCGIKYTHSDLCTYQLCLRADGGRWDVAYGMDEQLLAALCLGGRGAVGSGYNFAAPVYQRLLAAFGRGDLEAAREEQFRGVRLVQTLARRGYLPSAKALMGMLGVDVGPARLPQGRLDPDQLRSLRVELEDMGFFEWIQ